MGLLRFLAPGRERLAEQTVELAYVAGLEGVPWPCCCRCGATDGSSCELVVERTASESGNLYLPWCAEGIGEVVLSTASLMERARPYLLPVELARGTLNRLRNQLADWQLAGLRTPPVELDRLREVALAFSRAVTGADAAEAVGLAERTIRDALHIGRRLAAEYGRQSLAARRQQGGPLSVFFGGVAPPRAFSQREEAFVTGAWNSVAVPFSWRRLEGSPGRYAWDETDARIDWCSQHGLRVIGGPVVSLTAGNVPDWLYLWQDDYEQTRGLLLQFLNAVVRRYQGKVHIWNCVAGINVPGSLAIREEQRLRLAVTAVEELRRADPATPVLVTFDQPWGEYLSAGGLELSPLHFADALVRADLGIAGLGLEFNFGYWPGGTLPRDALEFSRHLDRWSLLGMPLVVFLAAPSATAAVAPARLAVRPPCRAALQPSPERQCDAAAQFVPLVLSKPFVQGFFWNQFSDEGADCEHGGLYDRAGNPKPVCAALTAVFQEHFV